MKKTRLCLQQFVEGSVGRAELGKYLLRHDGLHVNHNEAPVYSHTLFKIHFPRS